MRGICILSLLTVIIELLTAAQHYFPDITDLRECMYQYQQQRIINFYENLNTIILSIIKVYHNSRNKLVKTSKYTSNSIHNMDIVR